jgi:hypothetical protein
MKLIRQGPPKVPPVRAPQARPTPSTDKVIQDVREAKASDQRKGTGPQVPYDEPPETGSSMAPEPAAKSDVETTPDLRSALTDVADKLMDGPHDRPATLGHLAWALNSVARQIKPAEPQGSSSITQEDL